MRAMCRCPICGSATRTLPWVRRIIRETFRLYSPDLPALDVVVKVQGVPREGEAAAELADVLARLK